MDKSCFSFKNAPCQNGSCSGQPEIAPQQDQASKSIDNQQPPLKIQMNRWRSFGLVGALIFFAVLAGEGFMMLNHEPSNALQAQMVQSSPHQAITIVQQVVESTPLSEPVAEPTQTFIHSPLSGQNSTPDANFVEITNSANPTNAVNVFPGSNESEQQTIEKSVTPTTGEDSPFIELK